MNYIVMEKSERTNDWFDVYDGSYVECVKRCSKSSCQAYVVSGEQVNEDMPKIAYANQEFYK